MRTRMDPTDIDWDDLLAEAIEAMKHAYCPYSNFPVDKRRQ